MSNERNPYGYATNEWYEFEAKKAGFRSVEAYLANEKKTRGRCPYCGVTYGFNFGTGDCNCGED